MSTNIVQTPDIVQRIVQVSPDMILECYLSEDSFKTPWSTMPSVKSFYQLGCKNGKNGATLYKQNSANCVPSEIKNGTD